jgi:hypothetical protein
MKTEKTKFQDFLKKIGFEISPVYNYSYFSPRCRKDSSGNVNIIDKISICIWEDSNNPKRKIGCISFCYQGIERKFRHNYVNGQQFFYKEVVCKTSIEAIKKYNDWSLWACSELNKMKFIL